MPTTKQTKTPTKTVAAPKAAVKKAPVKKQPVVAATKAAPTVVKAEAKTVEIQTKLVRHQNKNVMISPRKLRLVADTIRKMSPSQALSRLKLTNTKAARIFVIALKNTIADAKNNFGLNPDTLKFDSLRVDEGMKIKRMDKSHGSRFARGLKVKRHSRIEIIVKGETQ